MRSAGLAVFQGRRGILYLVRSGSAPEELGLVGCGRDKRPGSVVLWDDAMTVTRPSIRSGCASAGRRNMARSIVRVELCAERQKKVAERVHDSN